MKQTTIIPGGGFHMPHVMHTVSAATTIVAQWATKVGHVLSDAMTQAKVAKMQSVMHAMTDEQLKRINLKRRDINNRATFLITPHSGDQNK